jgi:hypothetical protein
MARAKDRTLEATQTQAPVTARQREREPRSLETWTDGQPGKSDTETGTYYRSKAAGMASAKGYQEWIGRGVVEARKNDGLSPAESFFCAAFSLLLAGKERADLDREIDGTVDAETSEETLHNRLRTCGRGGSARMRKNGADYFEPREKINEETRFHDAVLRLFDDGFTREQLHRLAALAVEI